jgi:PST family polysaccharide transporter
VPRLRTSVLVLSVAHGVGLLAPLVAVPYLARVLRPEGWAPVLVAQAVALWVVLVLEFGFDLSATRALARTRHDPAGAADVVHRVQSAKFALVPLGAALVAIAFAVAPALAGRPSLLGWTIAFAVARGLDPFWYFQGLERVLGAVVVQATTRIAAALGVFFLVRGPADGAMVLALQAGFAALATLVLGVRMRGEVRFRLPSLGAARKGLTEGAPLFTFRAASGLFASANVFVLSLFAAPAAVAVFGGAERLARSGIGLLQPLTQAILPRVSHLGAADPAGARGVVRLSLRVVGLAGLVIGGVTFVFAPWIVALLLGDGYEAAVPLLRIFALLPPLVAIDTVLGLHWAVPLGHERPFVRAVVAGGLLNLVLAVALAPRAGGAGLVWAILAGEAVIFAVLARRYARERAG